MSAPAPTYYALSVLIESDATFSRGDSRPGLVDLEIEHDEHGCPRLGARRLKGLLRDVWQTIEPALGGTEFPEAARFLFGTGGDDRDDNGTARLQVGDAELPAPLRAAIEAAVLAGKAHRQDPAAPRPDEVLAALTAIRRQTALDAVTGAAESGTLRTMRALRPEVRLIAPLRFTLAPTTAPLALPLLAACCAGVRRGGTLRNRGRGRLRLDLHELAAPEAEPTGEPPDQSTVQTAKWFRAFAAEVRP